MVGAVVVRSRASVEILEVSEDSTNPSKSQKLAITMRRAKENSGPT
jgi:hypothetical protein